MWGRDDGLLYAILEDEWQALDAQVDAG